MESTYDVENWKSPIQSINGVVQGLQVKVCQKILADHMYALLRKPEHAVMNLICVYFIPEWCNVFFEIIDVDCKDGEPKQVFPHTS